MPFISSPDERIANNSDSFRRDLQRIADSLEEIAKCLSENSKA